MGVEYIVQIKEDKGDPIHLAYNVRQSCVPGNMTDDIYLSSQITTGGNADCSSISPVIISESQAA